MASLRFSWQPNPTQEQVISYDVNVFKDGGLLQSVNVPAATSFELPNPAPGAYAFNVRANNIAGSSAYSPSVQGPSVPSVPTGGSVTTVP